MTEILSGRGMPAAGIALAIALAAIAWPTGDRRAPAGRPVTIVAAPYATVHATVAAPSVTVHSTVAAPSTPVLLETRTAGETDDGAATLRFADGAIRTVPVHGWLDPATRLIAVGDLEAVLDTSGRRRVLLIAAAPDAATPAANPAFARN